MAARLNGRNRPFYSLKVALHKDQATTLGFIITIVLGVTVPLAVMLLEVVQDRSRVADDAFLSVVVDVKDCPSLLVV